MVRWHHQLNGHGFGLTLGVGDGQGGLACCGSWVCKESRQDCVIELNCTCLAAKSCLTLWDPVDYSPPGSSVNGMSQARILEWVSMSFFR